MNTVTNQTRLDSATETTSADASFDKLEKALYLLACIVGSIQFLLLFSVSILIRLYAKDSLISITSLANVAWTVVILLLTAVALYANIRIVEYLVRIIKRYAALVASESHIIRR